MHVREGPHLLEPLCLLLEWRAERLVIGQSAQLSHPSVSPRFRHAGNTISSMMAVISFEFVVLVVHFDVTQGAANPTLLCMDLKPIIECVQSYGFSFLLMSLMYRPMGI